MVYTHTQTETDSMEVLNFKTDKTLNYYIPFTYQLSINPLYGSLGRELTGARLTIKVCYSLYFIVFIVHPGNVI